ncbi:MAG: hypothetical protein AABY22_13870 [Nanoarchaeota archaeon]
MYKAYHFPTGHEYYFQFRPKKFELIKCLKEDDHYCDSMEEFEITKIKIIDNYPGDIEELNKIENDTMNDEIHSYCMEAAYGSHGQG